MFFDSCEFDFSMKKKEKIVHKQNSIEYIEKLIIDHEKQIEKLKKEKIKLELEIEQNKFDGNHIDEDPALFV